MKKSKLISFSHRGLFKLFPSIKKEDDLIIFPFIRIPPTDEDLSNIDGILHKLSGFFIQVIYII